MDWHDLNKARDKFYKKYPYEKDAYKITFEYYGPDAPLEIKRISDPYFMVQEILDFEDLRIFGKYADIINGDWSIDCEPNEEPKYDPIVTDYLEYYHESYGTQLGLIWGGYKKREEKREELLQFRKKCRHKAHIDNKLGKLDELLGVIELWALKNGYEKEFKENCFAPANTTSAKPQYNDEPYKRNEDFSIIMIHNKVICLSEGKRPIDFIRYSFEHKLEEGEFEMGPLIRRFYNDHQQHSPKAYTIGKIFNSGSIDTKKSQRLIYLILFKRTKQGWYRLNQNGELIH